MPYIVNCTAPHQTSRLSSCVGLAQASCSQTQVLHTYERAPHKQQAYIHPGGGKSIFVTHAHAYEHGCTHAQLLEVKKTLLPETLPSIVSRKGNECEHRQTTALILHEAFKSKLLTSVIFKGSPCLPDNPLVSKDPMLLPFFQHPPKNNDTFREYR